MKVTAISITKSLIQPDIQAEGSDQRELSAEDLIVFTARVSNPSNQMNLETAPGLLHFTIRNKHWSPFDMVNLCVEVVTSKAIGIQILRHWSIKPQEFSQRYAEVTSIEPIELRKSGATNRQSSTEQFDPSLEQYDEWGIKASMVPASHMINEYLEEGTNLYKKLLNAGVAKECARMVLPLTTSTTLYLNGSIRSWIHYLAQRLDPHAQVEHQRVAQEIEKIFKQHFPNVWAAVQLLKRDEDHEFIISDFFEWIEENEYFRWGNTWYNSDTNAPVPMKELITTYKSDKQWHKKRAGAYLKELLGEG